MKHTTPYPIIDVKATGANIRLLREQRNLSVEDVREFFGFSDPQAIYQWQRGISLPSVDHLCALSKLLDVSMDDILILNAPTTAGSHVSRQNHRCKHLFMFPHLFAA